MYLEEIENEYNITLSDPEKQYMLANEYTLVVHKDGYTLIKDKIKESCSAFKYVGVHSTGVNKTVDLNDHYLVREDLLGNVYEENDPSLVTILNNNYQNITGKSVIDSSSGILLSEFTLDMKQNGWTISNNSGFRENQWKWVDASVSCTVPRPFQEVPFPLLPDQTTPPNNNTIRLSPDGWPQTTLWCPPFTGAALRSYWQLGKVISFSYIRYDFTNILNEFAKTKYKRNVSLMNVIGWFGNYAIIYDNTQPTVDLSNQILCAYPSDGATSAKSADPCMNLYDKNVTSGQYGLGCGYPLECMDGEASAEECESMYNGNTSNGMSVYKNNDRAMFTKYKTDLKTPSSRLYIDQTSNNEIHLYNEVVIKSWNYDICGLINDGRINDSTNEKPPDEYRKTIDSYSRLNGWKDVSSLSQNPPILGFAVLSKTKQKNSSDIGSGTGTFQDKYEKIYDLLQHTHWKDKIVGLSLAKEDIKEPFYEIPPRCCGGIGELSCHSSKVECASFRPPINTCCGCGRKSCAQPMPVPTPVPTPITYNGYCGENDDDACSNQNWGCNNNSDCNFIQSCYICPTPPPTSKYCGDNKIDACASKTTRCFSDSDCAGAYFCFDCHI